MDTLSIRQGEDLVTLITCTPYGINTHRLCVEGYRISYTEETVEEIAQQEQSIQMRDWWWMGLTLVLLMVMGLLICRYLGSDSR